MADHEKFNDGPQRQAIPRMLIFIGMIVLLALAIMAWFAFGN
jgi:hypothetical protein